jgi:hypothetical protein
MAITLPAGYRTRPGSATAKRPADSPTWETRGKTGRIAACWPLQQGVRMVLAHGMDALDPEKLLGEDRKRVASSSR